MATDIRTNAGTKIAISATLPQSYDAAGFGAAGTVYTEIARVMNFGKIQQAFSNVDFNDVSNRQTITLKGTFNCGELALELARVDEDADAGQALLATAKDSDNDYAFKITLTDGTIYYFVGKVMSMDLNLGDVNSIIGHGCSIKLNGKMVKVLPT